MTGRSSFDRTTRLVVAAAMAASAACSSLGPASIVNGRAGYNEAIVATNSEQILTMIVRMRYGLPTGLLAVTSVTANVRVQASASSDIGIGADKNYDGNLTPLSAGVAYEENPTITYAPVQGRRYLRQFLSPIPLDLAVLLLGELDGTPLTASLLVAGINGMVNPAFSSASAPPGDDRFVRVVELFVDLARGGHAAWAQQGSDDSSFVFATAPRDERGAAQVVELYEALGLSAPRAAAGPLSLPVRLGFGKPADNAIVLRTRSLFELVTVAAEAVEVPAEHLAAGLAEPSATGGPADATLRIRASEARPTGATVAVRHDGWWFSIAGNDRVTKLVFRLIDVLLSARMAEGVEGHSPPVLTVPVSR